MATVLVLGGSGAERVRPTLNELARWRDDTSGGSLSPVRFHPWRVRHAAAAAWDQLNRDKCYGPHAHDAALGSVRFRDPLFLPYPPRPRVSYAGRPATAARFESGTPRGPCAPDRTPPRSPHTTTSSSSRPVGDSGKAHIHGPGLERVGVSTMSFPEATVRFQLIRTGKVSEVYDLELQARTGGRSGDLSQLASARLFDSKTRTRCSLYTGPQVNAVPVATRGRREVVLWQPPLRANRTSRSRRP